MTEKENRIIRLQPWEEVVGFLRSLINNEDGTLTQIMDTRTRSMRVGLHGCMENFEMLIGKMVGVLRTDDPKKPYVVRRIETRTGGLL